MSASMRSRKVKSLTWQIVASNIDAHDEESKRSSQKSRALDVKTPQSIPYTLTTLGTDTVWDGKDSQDCYKQLKWYLNTKLPPPAKRLGHEATKSSA
jgi:hypothetical protein